MVLAEDVKMNQGTILIVEETGEAISLTKNVAPNQSYDN
jgi:hypothetical protein